MAHEIREGDCVQVRPNNKRARNCAIRAWMRVQKGPPPPRGKKKKRASGQPYRPPTFSPLASRCLKRYIKRRLKSLAEAAEKNWARANSGRSPPGTVAQLFTEYRPPRRSIAARPLVVSLGENKLFEQACPRCQRGAVTDPSFDRAGRGRP